MSKENNLFMGIRLLVIEKLKDDLSDFVKFRKNLMMKQDLADLLLQQLLRVSNRFV